jgi:hypothetical protein
MQAFREIRRLVLLGLASVLGLVVAFPVGAEAATGPVAIYTQHYAAHRDCWATTWGTTQPQLQCRSWDAPLQTGLSSDYGTTEDFCLNYGNGAREMDRRTTRDLSSLIGFTVSSRRLEKVDPVSGTGCALAGTSSRWGMELQGSTANGYCVWGTCGLVHQFNFQNSAVRPFRGGRSLVFGDRFGVVSDNVGPYIPQGVWHAFVCPVLTDESTNQTVILCEETWRSDSGVYPFCHEDFTTPDGHGICTSGGTVNAVMAPGSDVGFRDVVLPGPGGVTTVWTRPGPNEQLSTTQQGSFRSSNVLGAASYAFSTSPDQLRSIIASYNLALGLDQQAGQHLGVRPMSTHLADWAMTSFSVGVEGNGENGATSTSIGVTSSNLYFASS